MIRVLNQSLQTKSFTKHDKLLCIINLTDFYKSITNDFDEINNATFPWVHILFSETDKKVVLHVIFVR